MSNYKQDAIDRWGGVANEMRHGRRVGKSQMGMYAKQYGKAVHENLLDDIWKDFDGSVVGPVYCECTRDVSRRLPINPELMDRLRTIALLMPTEGGGSFLLEDQGYVFAANASNKHRVSRGLTIMGVRFAFELVKVKKPVWKVHYVKM